ncbi:hypothetical protein JJB07_15460 [Tumebacillus sp. ITR2]|uniref:BclA C-terminal domain-containing protein n=1 Tax=Tumebacillus amylolyticus TaxID=2801339 RepID=A0ABS1JCM0_9BACL|nr:hypothetical protein [Tumebacillus amylolyticus]MBL0388015.1 hypothetical protein [Tumebacillus amylolyticus]
MKPKEPEKVGVFWQELKQSSPFGDSVDSKLVAPTELLKIVVPTGITCPTGITSPTGITCPTGGFFAQRDSVSDSHDTSLLEDSTSFSFTPLSIEDLAFAPVELTVQEPGHYLITYEISTIETSYFVLDIHGKIVAPTSYSRGTSGANKRDTGQIVLHFVDVPAPVRLQNVTGFPIQLAPVEHSILLTLRKLS